MAGFDVQSKLLRTLVLPEKRQAAPGGALADAAFTRVQRFDGAAVLEIDMERRSDADMSGKGSSFATGGQPTMNTIKITGVKAELSDWLAGWIMANLLGIDTVTSAVADTAPFTHAMKFDETTRTAVHTGVHMTDTDGLAYKVSDLTPVTVTLTIPEKGAIQVEFDLIGTGLYEATVLTGVARAVPDETYLLGNDTEFFMGDVGAPVSMLGRYQAGATIKFDTQAIVHQAPGGGLRGIFLRRGRPKFSVSLSIACKETDDVFARFMNNTKTALRWVTNSGASAQMQIDIPSANLKTTKMGFDDDMTIFSVEVDETTCYQVAGVPPITVAVTNDVASYLATA